LKGSCAMSGKFHSLRRFLHADETDPICAIVPTDPSESP